MVQHRLTTKLPWFHMHICPSRLLCWTNPLGVASLDVRRFTVTAQCLQHPLLQSPRSRGLPYCKYTAIVIILRTYRMALAPQLPLSKRHTEHLSSESYSAAQHQSAAQHALLWSIKVQKSGWRTRIDHLCTICSLGRKLTNLQAAAVSRGLH